MVTVKYLPGTSLIRDNMNYKILFVLLFLPLFLPLVTATTSQPTIQGIVFDANGNPASGATVRVTINSLLFNITTTDGSGYYSVVPSTQFDLSQPCTVQATLGNQTNSTSASLVDGLAPYTINVHIVAPPRYNITILTVDVNTHLPVSSAFVIANSDAYVSNTEIGSGYTNSTGKISFILGIDDNPFRFTALKSGTIDFPSGYPALSTTTSISHNATITLELGTVPIPNYNLTVRVINSTSQLPILNANVRVSFQTGNQITDAGAGYTNSAGEIAFVLPSHAYNAASFLAGYVENSTTFNLNSDKFVLLQLSPPATTSTPLLIIPLLCLVFLTAAIIKRQYKL